MSSSAQTVPLSVALVAGALVALNPCSVPLLPAFLSYYFGVKRDVLPRARTGLLQGLLVGALLTVGVVGVFTLIGLPLVYGASRITDAVPWYTPTRLLARGKSRREALRCIKRMLARHFYRQLRFTAEPGHRRRTEYLTAEKRHPTGAGPYPQIVLVSLVRAERCQDAARALMRSSVLAASNLGRGGSA